MADGVYLSFCRHGYPQYINNKEEIKPKSAIQCYMNGKSLGKYGKTIVRASVTPRAKITAEFYAKALGTDVYQDEFLKDGSLWLHTSPLEQERALDEYYQKIIDDAIKNNLDQIIIITHQPQLDFMIREEHISLSQCYYVSAKTWSTLAINLLSRNITPQKLILNNCEEEELNQLFKKNENISNTDEIQL